MAWGEVGAGLGRGVAGNFIPFTVYGFFTATVWVELSMVIYIYIYICILLFSSFSSCDYY